MSKIKIWSCVVSDLLQKKLKEKKGRSCTCVTNDRSCAVIDHSPLATGNNTLDILRLEVN